MTVPSFTVPPFARALAVLALLGAASCTPTQSINTVSHQATPALWTDLRSANAIGDTKRIMMLEAELVSRGQTHFGTQYVGQNTAGTIGRRLYPRTQPVSGDRNCSDFSSAAAAQKFFLANGGPMNDPHGLDRDGDGNACEWGATLRSSVTNYRRATTPAVHRTPSRRAASSSRCYVGPRGGTYTITASGRRNYGGC